MSESNSPSDAENQEHADTVPPPPADHHGWLEQFDLTKADAIAEIEKVAAGGLEVAEVDVLLYLAVKLTKIAEAHDPEAKAKVIAALQF